MVIPPSSPLSSAPSPSSAPGSPSSSSSAGAPSSPYVEPVRHAPLVTYSRRRSMRPTPQPKATPKVMPDPTPSPTRKATPKATPKPTRVTPKAAPRPKPQHKYQPKSQLKPKPKPKPRVKAKAEQPAVNITSSSPPAANLDDLLGDMGQDFAERRKRAKKRENFIQSIEREPPSSQNSVAPKRTAKRKREAEGEEKVGSQEGEDVAEHTPPRRPRKTRIRTPTLSPAPEEPGERESPAPPTATSSAVTPPPPSSPPAHMSSPPTGSPRTPPRARVSLVGRSFTTNFTTNYATSEVSDDEDTDLGAALLRELETPRKKANGLDFSDDDDLSEPPSPAWKPTSLPFGVEIGSTCLVLDTRIWYPARLLAFRPAADEHGKDYYRVQTQDREEYEPNRSKQRGRHSLMWLHEPAIAKLSIGRYMSEPVNRASKDGEPTSEWERFADLERKAQVDELRNHLSALVAERYSPAQWRIDMFFQSAAARSDLSSMTQYGDCSHDELVKVSEPIEEWVKKATSGSARFEALVANDRMTFADVVLLPEILIQICMRSFNLASPSTSAEAGDDIGADLDVNMDANGSTAPAALTSTIDRATDEARLYDLAREKLQELANNDANVWERRQFEVGQALKKAWKELGLDQEAAMVVEEPKVGPDRARERQAAWDRGKAREKEREERMKARRQSKTSTACGAAGEVKPEAEVEPNGVDGVEPQAEDDPSVVEAEIEVEASGVEPEIEAGATGEIAE